MTTIYLLNSSKVGILGSAQLKWLNSAPSGVGWAHSHICSQLEIEKPHPYV